ncbi:MAG TPA: type II toxin-antitoxin system VapC family toxin [Epsilonproteobacteria bacterium]|nr:type II toxin-antitoxin system VapC family toxin [Campylobacterota bacterium]HHE06120.1 type II toxin-antitoxin system VapC family toxin [Campylobacterota bacterium]
MNYDVLLDTDVIIWYLRGNQNAYDLIHSLNRFAISAVTYMELVQGMRDKAELRQLKRTLKQWQVKTIYMNEEISALALFYVEEYFLSYSMQLADALIGATCSNYGLVLYTANDKHYKIINDLEIKIFRP